MPVRLLRPYNGQNANTLYVGTDEAILRAIGIADDYIENATNFVPFASQAFRAFASSFSTASPAGSFITSFSNPFAGQGRGITTYTLTGTVPPQVALSASGRSLVVGSTAAVAGTIYSVNVTATSGDGLLTTQPATFNFMAMVQLPLVGGLGGGAIAQPDGYDVIVLAGQSNMVGRNGPIDGTLDATDARIFQYGFDSQTVTLASNPLDHQDEGANTIGMGLTFAKAYLATMPANRKILLVPCARGGTSFNSGFWRAGGGGDAPAIARTNAAMTQGTGTNKLVAILWHQGESDQGVSQAQYTTDQDALIARWRSSMTGATASTPFIVGATLVGGAQTDANVSAVIAATPSRINYTGFADSNGLVSGGDNLHFNAASQRTMGGRYFTAYQSAVTNVVSPTLKALTVSSTSGTVGASYTGTITGLTAGSAVTLTGAGAAGLAVSGSSITGTPTTVGSVNIVETLAGYSNSPRTTSSAITISGAAALAISGTPGSATQNTAYTFTPSTTGGSGTKTYSLTGTLPTGLSFSTTTGAITGTPTVAGTTTGLDITVTDTSGSASLGAFSLVVASASAGTNLITAPQNLATWTPGTESTVTNDVAANPVGGAVNVDRITQVANTSAHGIITPSAQGNVTSGQVYTFAADVKPETQNYLQLQCGSAINTGSVNFDLSSTGTVSATSGGATGAVTSIGGGYFRCAMTFTAASTTGFVGKANLIVSPTAARNPSEAVASGSEKSLLFTNAQAVAGSVANAF